MSSQRLFLAVSKVLRTFQRRSALTGEGITFCIAAFCSMTAGNINGGGCTFAVVVVGTFLSLTVNIDLFTATVLSSTVHGRAGRIAVAEASAGSILCMAGICTGYLDITSGTEFVFVVHAFYSRTFQNCDSQFIPSWILSDLCVHI